MAVNWGSIDPNSAYKGIANSNALLQSYAQRRAGQALAKGDRQGAQSSLLNEGMIDQSFNIDDHFNKEDARVAALDDKKKAEGAAMVLDVANALKEVQTTHGEASVVPAFEQLVPIFKQRGASDEEIATYREQLSANPSVFLDAISSRAQQTMARFKFLQSGPDIIVGDQTTGETQVAHQGLRTVGKDQILVQPGSPEAAAAGAVDPNGAPQSDMGTPDAKAMEMALNDLVPGVQITGRGRTAQRNAEVGGVPNSFHLTNEALDFKPKPGTDVKELRKQMEAVGLPVTELIDEGDHFHWAWGDNGKKGPGGPSTTQGATDAQVVARGPTSQKGAWRAASPEEAAQRGYQAGQINDQTGEFKGPAPPKPAAAGKGGVEVSKQTEIALNKLRPAVEQSRMLLGLIDEFVGLNASVNTGGRMAIPGIAAAASPFNAKLARMISIQNQLTPAMRNGLPGAASDKDVAMFRGATVGPDKPYAANLAIARATKAFVKRQGDYVAFMENWAKTHGDLLGAQELWNRYADDQGLFELKDGVPYPRQTKGWREYFSKEELGTGGAASTNSGPKVRKWTPDGGLQ